MLPTNIIQKVKRLLYHGDVFGAFHNSTGNISTVEHIIQEPEGLQNLNYTTVASFSSFEKMLQKGDFTTLELISAGIKMFFSYSVSKYAVLCYSTAIILNRLSVMSSLRSNSTSIRLPPWSKTLLHLIAILSLINALSQILGQFGYIHQLRTDDADVYALNIYFFTALSDCVEVFISSTTNALLLKCADFSLWGLSLNLFIISKLSAGQKHIGDNVELLGTVSHRLLIHLVELLHMRSYRLFADSALNVGFFITFIARTYLSGFDFINICLIHNYFPNFFYIFVILLASIGISLKALFTGNLFRLIHSRSIWALEKWWRSSDYSGEEEFNEVALSLCLLLTSRDHNLSKRSDTEKTTDKVSALSNSYMVSGHLNQLQSTPEDLLPHKEITTGSHLPGFINTYLGLFELVKAILLKYFRLLRNHLWNKNLETNIDHKPEVKKSSRIDLNRYVTEKNYKKFFYKPDIKECDPEIDLRYGELLLPEDDSSRDYVPPKHIKDSALDERFDDDGDSRLVIEEEKELTHLSSNIVDFDNLKEIAWNVSMWSILKYKMDEHNEIKGPLTRSQYGKKNSEGVLVDVVIERLLHHKSATHVHKRLDMRDEEPGFKFDYPLDGCDEMDNIDLSCIICKVNKRNIVTWPCRCLALCDECRISLGYKGFGTCVSCDNEVRAYSKLNIV
ncbi:hypothetical protein SKDZ_14G3110 [Saccharomyces kudriavzevii ZP591]|nr:hypothetical protein SKDZ_14G3110 [Saccharomyces kudriavzevii ZP591]